MDKIRQRTCKNMEKTVKVNLGSGSDYREGYINVDNGLMFPDVKVDVKSDIKDFEMPDNYVDEILLSHVVMYLRPEELRPLLKKWYGWLKGAGYIEIETSDFKKLAIIGATETLQEIIDNDSLTNIFGKPNNPPHKWSWSKDALSRELKKVGFDRFGTRKGLKKPERDFIITAIK